MFQYAEHCYHMDGDHYGLDGAEYPAAVKHPEGGIWKAFSSPKLIDVRAAKVFCCWIKTTTNCRITFDYVWEDGKTVLQTTASEPTKAGEFTRFQFGTYAAGTVSNPMPAIFLRLNVYNLDNQPGNVTFRGVSQLQ